MSALPRILTVGALVFLLGCGGGKLDDGQKNARTAALPDGHPPVSGQTPPMMGADDGPTDDHELPIKLAGLNSVEELAKGRAATQNAEAADLYEQGFRLTFTSDRGKRDYAASETLLLRALELDPEFPHAYRALGYAQFNQGFNVPAAMENYQKAVGLDPDYGEVHYALAFLYVTSDLESGAGHFRRAMELGVPDERDLRTRFYPEEE